MIELMRLISVGDGAKRAQSFSPSCPRARGTGPMRYSRLKGCSAGPRAAMYPYVAPHTARIHTPITLGIRGRIIELILKPRKRRPGGFDSHRPLHFWTTSDNAGLLARA